MSSDKMIQDAVTFLNNISGGNWHVVEEGLAHEKCNYESILESFVARLYDTFGILILRQESKTNNPAYNQLIILNEYLPKIVEVAKLHQAAIIHLQNLTGIEWKSALGDLYIEISIFMDEEERIKCEKAVQLIEELYSFSLKKTNNKWGDKYEISLPQLIAIAKRL